MLDNTCLVKLAMVDGCTLGAYQSVIAAAKGWECFVGTFLEQRLQQLLHSFDIASVVEREKPWVAFKYLHDSSLVLYKTLQPEYQYACYLAKVKCFQTGGWVTS